MFISGCTVSKDIQKNKTQTDSIAKNHDELKTNTQIKTDTHDQITSTTETTESVDTTVKVIIPAKNIDPTVVDQGKMITVTVPIRINRTVKRQEYENKTEQKQQNTQSDLKKNDQINVAKSTDTVSKKIKRNNTWGLILGIIGGLGVIVAVYFIYKKIKGRILL